MIAIRPATVADAPRCAEIYAPFVTDSWVSFETDPPDDAAMAGRIAGALDTHDWLVAETDGRVLGYAYGSGHRTRAAYHTSCDVAAYVDPDHKRRGIGRSLYEALLPRLKARKMHAAFAGIALPNEASIALHRAMGFDPVGIYRQVGWKMGGWRDVAWFQQLL
ncbi:GNAT family N-acetyltransferase [Sphingopyxis sp. BSNA05]|uniref:arsinothricin resistance N-acetyltransferase ArsN1 family B n=1 Tax=Sphingopyxis sp. BSNA05 TaxID=1236614 RepID=UPI00156597E5|nr:arsinothricin resistance N-acetyltransferase ArsN1 family B [Sphingopyxis sp. BSNA05]NRD88648.1 GNAT family N-acetyltransferase [Sphingopyxis sp. BSNA05]